LTVSFGFSEETVRIVNNERVKAWFADCRLDTDTRQLFRGAKEVHLSPKAFELLKLLVECRPRALSKAEMLDTVWPGIFVSDASLARVINEIREGVGDLTPRARIIRTVHRYGYAFAAEAVEDKASTAPAPAAPGRSVCEFLCGRREFPLPDGEHIAGREPGVEVWLDSPRVSRRHARILVAGDRGTIEDLGSKNGTFVRGARIAAPTALASGDDVRIGPFTLTFFVARQGPTETEVEPLP
jgi:DNA-binding winged helix-turn-helix (wHTH) protein